MKYLVFYIVTGFRGEIIYSGTIEQVGMEPEVVAGIVKERVRDTRSAVEVHVTGMLRLDA